MCVSGLCLGVSWCVLCVCVNVCVGLVRVWDV